MEHVLAAAKAYRKSARLSQADFAIRFGLQPDTYRQWERGRRRPDMASVVLLRIIIAEPEMVAEVVKTACAAPASR